MSRKYIISVPDDAGFVEYSYIRGGRKYNTHYAYKSMGRLVRCGECKHREEYPCKVYRDDDDWYCADGEREGE